MTVNRLAVVPVRAGVIPAGGADAVVEAGGRGLIVGTGARSAAAELRATIRAHVDVIELSAAETDANFAALARALVAIVANDDVRIVIVPASPDGRDLAPLLAHHLDRPLLAGAIDISEVGATCSRWGGRVLEALAVDGGFVATLQPNAIGLGSTSAIAVAGTADDDDEIITVRLDVDGNAMVAESLAVLAPDVATMDLTEAERIVGGGAGLDSADRFDQLATIAARLGAAIGGTRVITDRGWIAHERQIGTTGAAVSPSLYVAFGISGAVQHTAGLGDPVHIVAVNTDPHCPMMQLADLAIIADANATLDELAARLAAPAEVIDA